MLTDRDLGITVKDDVLKQIDFVASPPKKSGKIGSLFATISGKSDKEKVNYEYDGYDRDVALILIEHEGDYRTQSHKIMDKRYEYNLVNFDTFERTKLYIDYIYNHITDVEYEIKLNDYLLSQKQITEKEHEKAQATLKKEPYVFVEAELDAKSPKSKGVFSLDWNSYFVEELIKNGFSGKDEEEIVEYWFQALCKTVSYENEIQNLENQPGLSIKQQTENGNKKSYF